MAREYYEATAATHTAGITQPSATADPKKKREMFGQPEASLPANEKTEERISSACLRKVLRLISRLFPALA